MSEKRKISILLVEDDALDRMAVERSFKAENLPYFLEFAETIATAEKRLAQGGIDLVLLDQGLPDGTGLEIQKQLEGTPSVFLTGSGDTSIAIQAMKAGAYDYLIKDIDRDYLLILPITIEKALERKHDADELDRYRLHLEEEVEQRTVELREANKLLNIEISERAQAEDENKFNAERFIRWKASNFIGIIQSTAKGSIDDANNTLLAMLGYSRKDLLDGNLDWTKLTPPEFLHLDQEAMEEAAEKGFWTLFEKEYFHKDGHRVPIIIGGSIFKETPDEYIVFIVDLTEQKRVEEEKPFVSPKVA